MRVFNDEAGRRWEVATAFGSYGETRLIFSPFDGDELRSGAIVAETQFEAEKILADLPESELVERLNKAEAFP